MQIQALKLPKPELEYKFHPTRKWRADFAWPAWRVIIEVEGAVFAGGRHTRGRGFEADCLKYNAATELGWRVFRFSTGQVNQGYAMQLLQRVLINKPEDKKP